MKGYLVGSTKQLQVSWVCFALPTPCLTFGASLSPLSIASFDLFGLAADSGSPAEVGRGEF